MKKTTIIDKQMDIINQAIALSEKYDIPTFPTEELKELRRHTKKIKSALEENCSVAAFGESQVGKSYLINSLLSSPEIPFVIENAGIKYSFIDSINSSGGNISQTETTGVITRFTAKTNSNLKPGLIRIKNLTISDLILLILDSYYSDLKINPETALNSEEINSRVRKLQQSNKERAVQGILTEDDVKDIRDYCTQVLGSLVQSIIRSDFFTVIPQVIHQYLPDEWVDIFSLLWNDNQSISNLFSLLISEYAKIDFVTSCCVPFEAVLRKNGTLLKIEWLDRFCGVTNEAQENDVPTTDVFDDEGNLIVSGFSKASLSALIAELTFILPNDIIKERPFLQRLDLLDLPGARAREKVYENDAEKILPTILRRGKVAYLFNKYSRSLKISSILFCHHNDMKSEPTIGNMVSDWIYKNIGSTPAERYQSISRTNGISPFFFIATKFNKELELEKNDSPDNLGGLDNHWKRFDIVYPEIIKPATWFDDWIIDPTSNRTQPFQNLYLLRDFYWSNKNKVFTGYSDKETKSRETEIYDHPEFPDFLRHLRESFLGNNFVQKHFVSPQKAWEGVATINNDGSKLIIEDLNAIAEVLEEARDTRYKSELIKINEKVQDRLLPYYEPEDEQQNNVKLVRQIGGIRMSLHTNIGSHPELFGKIIDSLMLPVDLIRNLTYDIVTLKSETPRDVNEIILIQKMVGLSSQLSREENISKLESYYFKKQEVLDEYFREKGFSIDDLLASEYDLSTTIADLLTKRIFEVWTSFLNSKIDILSQYLPHADDIIFMFLTLSEKLSIRTQMTTRIDLYTKVIQEEELPNIIADYSCLCLNNFVSTIGTELYDTSIKKSVLDKAEVLNIGLNQSFYVHETRGNASLENLIDTLRAFDDAPDVQTVSINTLMKLPFWNNFQAWQNRLIAGLICVSNVSKLDPIINENLKKIIDASEVLYETSSPLNSKSV